LSTVAALCASHTPLKDYRSPGAEIEAEVAACFDEVKSWVADFAPDLLVVIGPDHFNGFFYAMMPGFCIGAAAEGIGDWKTPRGALPVDAGIAERCVRTLQRDGVDPALSYRMMVDHGCTQIIDQLFDWNACPDVLPVFVNCVAPPLPPLERVVAFGTSLGRFLNTIKRRVLIIGSGGLSHDPPVPALADAPPPVRERLIMGGELSPEARNERQQRVLDEAARQASGTGDRTPLNPEWDQQFIASLIAGDYAGVCTMSDDGITRDAGCGGHEIRTWIAASAAATAAGAGDARLRYYRPISEWIAGYGVLSIA